MSEQAAWRVAIVGAGPAGFYAAEALLRQSTLPVEVDLFDRLPVPYGLVRFGVAPDHPRIKAVIRLFRRTAARRGFRFLGHVEVGRDLSVAELLGSYHQVLFCSGAAADRRLGLPGEELPGSHSATEFVGWYNAQPDFAGHRFDLRAASAAIIGQGNVALDVARILASPPHVLARTDIAAPALAALEQSQVRQIHLIGRRGPAQAAFSAVELRELCQLEGVDVRVPAEALELDAASQAQLETAADPSARRNLAQLRAQASLPPRTAAAGARTTRVQLHFWKSPAAILGPERVEGLALEHNLPAPREDGQVGAKGSGRLETLAAGLVFRAVGYRGLEIAGLPFDSRRGIIPNQQGRVVDAQGRPQARLYVAGWIKRGPQGVIGTNKQDAQHSVAAMLEEAQAQASTPWAHELYTRRGTIDSLLARKGLRVVSFADWERLDALEIQRGAAQGKPREKFLHIREMLAALE